MSLREMQLAAVLDALTMLTLPCKACGQRNRVAAAKRDRARCGKCGLPLRVQEAVDADRR